MVPIVVTFQLVGAANFPLNATVLEPWLAPKPDPLIATVVPAAPDVGERLLITGVTVKVTLLLAVPLTLTTTGPVVAAAGTVATIEFVFQLVGLAARPLKVSVLDPWLEPKLDPLTVTDVPTAPLVGERLPIEGDLPPTA